jgi:hypothetical protein
MSSTLLGRYGPSEKIRQGAVEALTPDERETISAFSTRFASYQEYMGKAMRSVAIEEESAISPFGAIVALMDKLEILDDVEQCKTIRELRNSVNHEYEDRPEELFQILSNNVVGAPWLFRVHEKLSAFVQDTY